jgi:hypothetical protein
MPQLNPIVITQVIPSTIPANESSPIQVMGLGFAIEDCLKIILYCNQHDPLACRSTCISDTLATAFLEEHPEGKDKLQAIPLNSPWNASNAVDIFFVGPQQAPNNLVSTTATDPMIDYHLTHALDPLQNAIGSGEFLNIWKKSKEVSSTDLEKVDYHFQSPLHRAVLHNMALVAEILVKQGAPVDIKDGMGETPLHWAVRLGSLKMIDALLQLGADENAVNHKGVSPLALAEQLGNLAVIDLLQEFDDEELEDESSNADSNVYVFTPYTPARMEEMKKKSAEERREKKLDDGLKKIKEHKEEKEIPPPQVRTTP